MSLFQNLAICADYFGDELPLPLPAVKTMEQKKKKNNAYSTDTETAAKIINKDDTKNRALTITPSFDGLFHFETMEQKKEKKNADSTDTKTAKTLNIDAAIDNVVVGESKKNSSKNRALAIAPAFDGLFPFEMFVSR